MLGPTPVEISSGVVVGSEPTTADAERMVRAAHDPLTALEDAIRPALLRGPCLVSFSGGLDSSFILAVACRVARAEGLPLPIPYTWRFTRAPRADESAWQERVISALGLIEWVTVKADDDLDLVGPVAQRVLLRHGLLHPVNVHLHLPIVEEAAGGSLLTGAGGDQILGGWARRAERGFPHRVYDVLPRPLRARVRQLRGHDPLPWLDATVSRRVLCAHQREQAAQPVGFGQRLAWHAGRRDIALTASSLRALALESDVELVNPLLDDRLRASLVELVGDGPAPTRPELLARVAGDALPAVCFEARDKARFREVFFRSPTRDLVSTWDGSGVDADLVDVVTLKSLWSTWPVPPGTAGLVQQVWLATHQTGNSAARAASSGGSTRP